jgi:hypothetical protein
MSTQTNVPGPTRLDGPGRDGYPHRVLVAVVAGLTAVGAAAGASQLLTGGFGMPVDDLEPLGLTSWVLPGIWLFASVAVPCATASVLALRRGPTAPLAAVVAGGLLAVELLVQIPFVGLNPLQALFGLVAVALVGLGLDARRRGWR